MARLSVYVSDELLDEVRAVAGRVNVSALTQAALRALIECDHDELRCERCAESIDALDLRDDAMGALYADLLWQLGELLQGGGTVEGACRVAKRVGESHAVSAASRLPLPRLSARRRRELADQRAELVA